MKAEFETNSVNSEITAYILQFFNNGQKCMFNNCDSLILQKSPCCTIWFYKNSNF